MSDYSDILAMVDKHLTDDVLDHERSRRMLAIKVDPAAIRRAAAHFSRPYTPEEIRVRVARQVRSSRPGTWGRRGLPADVWKAMYAEYCAGKSCAEVAAIFGGTRQSIHEIFKHHNLKLRPRHPRLLAKIVYGGIAYTPGKGGYYRQTGGDRTMLHHVIWADANGPIPEGHMVSFKNADHTDVRLDNMQCMPIAEVTRYHRARHLAAAPVLEKAS